MNIKDLLQDDALKALEDQIIMSFEGLWSKDHDYTEERSLLQVRQNIINHRVLQHQDLLLPDIIAFNDAMSEALREMFDKAHAVYEANKGFGEDLEVEACCYLSNDYPALHPVQGEDRQDLWNALQDSGWNLLYEGGVAFPLQLRGNGDPNSNDFEEFIGMKCPPPNWNEGLDQELTKDLQLISSIAVSFTTKSNLSSVMKHSKTIDAATIARLLSHDDKHGMGSVFMYAFLNEVVRQKRPFPFDCESAQVSSDLMIVDNQGRSIAVEYKRNRLSLTLNDQRTVVPSRIEYKDEAYRQVLLDWLAACIRYTSLQPELRKELTRYAQSFQRRIWFTKVLPVH